MNYQACIHYLEKEVGFASCPGLERIQDVMEKLNHPEERLKVIHIAGTNGKGSAVALLSSVLKEAGYRVGCYTSPHLERYNERMTINGEEITDEDFAYYITQIKEVSNRLAAEEKAIPTLFEIITAAAYLYFAEQHMDIVIMEVGLGGRFDATNVIDSPLLSLIMSISLDHMDYLGNTIQEIAAEKAGIIKKNCPVVLYSQDKIVYNIVKEIAQEKGAVLFYAKNSSISVSDMSLEQTVFSVTNSLISYKDLFLPLLGEHQIKNCITVLEACEILKENGFILNEMDIRNGIAHAFWAGRMEICNREPLVVLDGAHNLDGIHHLAEAAKAYFSDKSITVLMGVLGDKEYQKMAASIFPLAKQIILTEPHNERKLAATSLGEIAKNHGIPFFVEPNMELAYEKAYSITEKHDAILCCGSLYMIGALRSYLMKK